MHSHLSLDFSCVFLCVSVSARVSSEYRSYLDVLVSESMRGAASVSLVTPLHLSVLSWNGDARVANDYLCKARALVVKLPGFFFSSYRQTAKLSSVVVPMEQYTRVMKDVYYKYAVPDRPPKQKLLIRLTAGATRSQREDLINGLRTFFRSDQTQAIDTQSLIATMDQAVALMNLFFTLVGAIAMVGACATSERASENKRSRVAQTQMVLTVALPRCV